MGILIICSDLALCTKLSVTYYTYNAIVSGTPFPINITSDPEGKYMHKYTLVWGQPKTGGLPIVDYMFKFRKVSINHQDQVE